MAVEKGEVVCPGFTMTTLYAREPFHTWRKKTFVRVLVQTGKKRDARLAALALPSGEFGRPIIATPGIPPERINILREAYSKTLKDPELLVEAKKKNLEIDPTGGEELESLAQEVLSASKDLIERMKNYLVNRS